MSKIGYFLAVKPERGDELANDPASVADFLDESIDDQDELGADFLDVDKSWQGIHFLLTGEATGGEAPLAWAVIAPTEIGEGRARLLGPDDVAAVSKALAPLTADKLKRKCDWNAMNERGIYPQSWQRGDEEYIADNFSALKKFYESAVRRRLAVVQWING